MGADWVSPRQTQAGRKEYYYKKGVGTCLVGIRSLLALGEGLEGLGLGGPGLGGFGGHGGWLLQAPAA